MLRLLRVEVMTPLQLVKKIKDNLSPALSWEEFFIVLFVLPWSRDADIFSIIVQLNLILLPNHIIRD